MIVESQADLGQQIQVHGDPWDPWDPHGTHGKVVERSNKLMIFYGNQWEMLFVWDIYLYLSENGNSYCYVLLFVWDIYLNLSESISRSKIGDILYYFMGY